MLIQGLANRDLLGVLGARHRRPILRKKQKSASLNGLRRGNIHIQIELVSYLDHPEKKATEGATGWSSSGSKRLRRVDRQVSLTGEYLVIHFQRMRTSFEKIGESYPREMSPSALFLIRPSVTY